MKILKAIMKKKIMYSLLLAISSLFLLLLGLKIGQCESESYGWYGPNNIIDLLINSGLFLLVEFVVFAIDNIVLLIKKILKKELNNSELYCLIGAFIMFFIWVLLNRYYSNNGSCDLIIGPGDTGLFLAMLVTTIINIWKIRVIK